MAFSSEMFPGFPTSLGGLTITAGTFSNTSGSTGGDIDTGLGVVYIMILQPTGSSVVANAAVVNESLPAAGNAVTVVTDADMDGIWIAIGI